MDICLSNYKEIFGNKYQVHDHVISWKERHRKLQLLDFFYKTINLKQDQESRALLPGTNQVPFFCLLK